MKANTRNVHGLQRLAGHRRATGIIRKSLLALLVPGLGLALAACEHSSTNGTGIEKRLSDLETQVVTLKDQNRDLRVKLGAFHGFGRSPLQDFFASPEFWQCTYDTSWSDCSSRCSKQTADGFALCMEKPEGQERQDCIDLNSRSGQACLKACPVQTSPTDPPQCHVGPG